jgi:hypothetical protein
MLQTYHLPQERNQSEQTKTFSRRWRDAGHFRDVVFFAASGTDRAADQRLLNR